MKYYSLFATIFLACIQIERAAAVCNITCLIYTPIFVIAGCIVVCGSCCGVGIAIVLLISCICNACKGKPDEEEKANEDVEGNSTPPGYTYDENTVGESSNPNPPTIVLSNLEANST